MLEGEALETGDENKRKKAKSFHKLIEMKWNEEVSTHALRTLGERKRNKVKLLPLTSDVKLMTEMLKSKGRDAFEVLSVKKIKYLCLVGLEPCHLSANYTV